MFLVASLQVKPCRARLGTGWATHCQHHREGPCFVLSAVLHIVWRYFKSVLESIFSFMSAAICKKKIRPPRRYNLRANYCSLAAVQSRNFDLSAGKPGHQYTWVVHGVN